MAYRLQFCCSIQWCVFYRVVRVGVIQNCIVADTSEPVATQRDAIHNLIAKIIHSAAECKVNVLCLQEAWSKYSVVNQITNVTLSKDWEVTSCVCYVFVVVNLCIATISCSYSHD